jgi:reactive chlorine resistance protein C
MTDTAFRTSNGQLRAEHTVAVVGREFIRYGLVIVLIWIGALKFTAYEAQGIQPLVAHQPLMSWLYDLLSVRAFAATLGTVEIIAAVLIASKPLWPRVSLIGSAVAILLFLSTLSFLFTTPGVIQPSAGGFPALSVLPGQFLLKDIVLLAVAIWTLGDALTAVRSARPAASDQADHRVPSPMR